MDVNKIKRSKIFDIIFGAVVLGTVGVLAGLSMGGMETKTITLKNLDTFSHIGLFSGGTLSLDDVNNTSGFKDKVKLVFVSYGSRELGGGRRRFGGDPKENADALKQAGINSVFYVSPDTAHEFQSWRRSLHEFAQLMFREEARPEVPQPRSAGARRGPGRGGLARGRRRLPPQENPPGGQRDRGGRHGPGRANRAASDQRSRYRIPRSLDAY